MKFIWLCCIIQLVFKETKMENKKTAYQQAKEKYDKLMNATGNEVKRKRSAIEKMTDADPDVVCARETVEEYKRKAQEAKDAFVEECELIISDLFFFDKNYKKDKKNELLIAEKYPDVWGKAYLNKYITLFEPEYDELGFDECLKIVNDDYIKNYGIRKKDGTNGRITRDFIADIISFNKEKTNMAENKKNSLLRRKKIFGIFKSLGNRIDEKVSKLEQEVRERKLLSSLLTDIDTRILRASFATCELPLLLCSKNLRNFKLYKSVYMPYERSLKKMVDAYKENLKEEVGEIRRKGKDEALKSFSKEELSKIATSAEDYFELGVISAKSGKIPEYLRAEFSGKERI